MNKMDQSILAAIRSPSPPQVLWDLIEVTGGNKNYCNSRLATLIKDGTISIQELPWRKRKTYRHHGARSSTMGDIEDRLDDIANENGKDRVTALKALAEIRSSSGDASSHPIPNDPETTLNALIRIMDAAGRPIVSQAFGRAFPSAILPSEASSAQTPQTDLAGPATGGDRLD